MSEKEFDLFLAFIKNSRIYAEFGAGGSTYVASQYVESSILALDSSIEWLENVEAACANNKTRPELILVDIGPVGAWGYPTDPATTDLWPAYHQTMFTTNIAEHADLYLIDGRFRVACLAQTILHCRKDALIMFHDFRSREQYHCVREIAREIATAEDLSVFMPVPGADVQARNILQAHQRVPA